MHKYPKLKTKTKLRLSTIRRKIGFRNEAGKSEPEMVYINIHKRIQTLTHTFTYIDR